MEKTNGYFETQMSKKTPKELEYVLFIQKLPELIPNVDKHPLDFVFENNLVNKNGYWMEFGVYSGITINHISRFTSDIVYGFDTFTGLPELWDRPDMFFNKGHFDRQGEFPPVHSNVKLIKGLFKDTLPEFVQQHNPNISFLHIDCDLYSSTKDVFDHLGKYICNKCIIIFDELVNYPNFHEHELKAFYEWISQHNIVYEWVGMFGKMYINIEHDNGAQYQSVALKIINNPIFKK